MKKLDFQNAKDKLKDLHVPKDKLKDLHVSKDKLKDIATDIGNKTKDIANDIGDKTKDFTQATKKAVATASENIKETNDQLSRQFSQAKFDKDKKQLCPFYEENLNDENFSLPAMVRLVTYDKRRDNKACEGAIGFETNSKEMRMLNIYTEFASMLGIRFYPLAKDSVYYVDPCYPDLYISLDDYFSYLKKVRVDELQAVAQDLGAKHVSINLREQRKSSKTSKKTADINSYRVKASGNLDQASNEMYNLEVAAEVDFRGKDTPVEPKLVYFKNESDINALIKMRMNPESKNSILSKTYSFQYSNSSGIKVNEAMKINTTLKTIDAGIGETVLNEALSESRTYLEYGIEF